MTHRPSDSDQFNDNVKCLVHGFAIRRIEWSCFSFSRFAFLSIHSIATLDTFNFYSCPTFYDIQFISLPPPSASLAMVWSEMTFHGGQTVDRMSNIRQLDIVSDDMSSSCEKKKNNDETSENERNSPYCIVRIIFKFLIGSGFDSTSNSSITTDVTRLESSADAAFIVFSTFPWSMTDERKREKRRIRVRESDNQKVNILNYMRTCHMKCIFSSFDSFKIWATNR